MIEKIKEYLSEHGWSSIDDILDNVPAAKNHYANPKASLRATLRERWNEHWIETKQCKKNRQLLYRMKQEKDEVDV